MLAAAIVAVHIVSQVGGAGPVDETPKHARADEGVTLYAVVDVKEGGKVTRYSDAAELRLGRTRVAARPLAELPVRAAFHWYKVEPTSENLSNTASGRFAFEAIEYDEAEVGA